MINIEVVRNVENGRTQNRRVLCIIRTIDLGGGAEQLLIGLLPELRKHGYECELVALCDWPNDIGYLLEEQGVLVHRLHLSHPWNFLAGMLKFRALLAARPYDLVWGHMFDGNLYARLPRMDRSEDEIGHHLPFAGLFAVASANVQATAVRFVGKGPAYADIGESRRFGRGGA